MNHSANTSSENLTADVTRQQTDQMPRCQDEMPRLVFQDEMPRRQGSEKLVSVSRNQANKVKQRFTQSRKPSFLDLSRWLVPLLVLTLVLMASSVQGSTARRVGRMDGDAYLKLPCRNLTWPVVQKIRRIDDVAADASKNLQFGWGTAIVDAESNTLIGETKVKTKYTEPGTVVYFEIENPQNTITNVKPDNTYITGNEAYFGNVKLPNVSRQDLLDFVINRVQEIAKNYPGMKEFLKKHGKNLNTFLKPLERTEVTNQNCDNTGEEISVLQFNLLAGGLSKTQSGLGTCFNSEYKGKLIELCTRVRKGTNDTGKYKNEDGVVEEYKVIKPGTELKKQKFSMSEQASGKDTNKGQTYHGMFFGLLYGNGQNAGARAVEGYLDDVKIAMAVYFKNEDVCLADVPGQPRWKDAVDIPQQITYWNKCKECKGKAYDGKKTCAGEKGCQGTGRAGTKTVEILTYGGHHYPKEILAEFRWLQMVREILSQAADIMTMQELDHYWDFMGPLLHAAGYKSHFLKKGGSIGEGYCGGMRDGCAIFWNEDKYKFIKQQSQTDFMMVTLQSRASGRKFNVITAHMKSGGESCHKECKWHKKDETTMNPYTKPKQKCGGPKGCAKRTELKNNKIADLVNLVMGSKAGVPFIIGLDLNSNEKTVAYRHLMKLLKDNGREVRDTHNSIAGIKEPRKNERVGLLMNNKGAWKHATVLGYNRTKKCKRCKGDGKERADVDSSEDAQQDDEKALEEESCSKCNGSGNQKFYTVKIDKEYSKLTKKELNARTHVRVYGIKNISKGERFVIYSYNKHNGRAELREAGRSNRREFVHKDYLRRVITYPEMHVEDYRLIRNCSTYKERWAGAQPKKIDAFVVAQQIDFILTHGFLTQSTLRYPSLEACQKVMPEHGDWLPNIKQGSDHLFAFSRLRWEDLPLEGAARRRHQLRNAEAQVARAVAVPGLQKELQEELQRCAGGATAAGHAVSRRRLTNKPDSEAMKRLLRQILDARHEENEK